jgi:hypothetical protein
LIKRFPCEDSSASTSTPRRQGPRLRSPPALPSGAGEAWLEVDLVAFPVDYLTGTTPERYAGQSLCRRDDRGNPSPLDVGRLRDSRKPHQPRPELRVLCGDCGCSGRESADSRRDLGIVPTAPDRHGGSFAARRFRRPWIFEIRDLWPVRQPPWLASADGWAYRMLERAAHAYASRAGSVIVPTPGLQRAAYAARMLASHPRIAAGRRTTIAKTLPCASESGLSSKWQIRASLRTSAHLGYRTGSTACSMHRNRRGRK